MKISESAPVTPIDSDAPSDDLLPSDSFARRLSEKSKKPEVERSQSAVENGVPNYARTAFEPNLWPRNDGVEASQEPGSSVLLPIAELASEVVHESRPLEATKTGAVEIVFDSKVLEGLQVRVQQEGGLLHVDFQTPSESLEKLLAGRVGELRHRLERRGIRIGSIAVHRGRRSRK